LAAYEETLRRLTLHDERLIEEVLGGRCTSSPASLEPRVVALVRLGALIGTGGPGTSYARAVDVALASGTSLDELVAALLAVGPIVGSAQLVDAAPKLALGLGYDVEDELETIAPR
jgi:hypothetical protein